MLINKKPLHPNFGVIIEDIDLNQVSHNFLYKEIRELFENYSVILFKNQKISDDFMKISKFLIFHHFLNSCENLFGVRTR